MPGRTTPPGLGRRDSVPPVVDGEGTRRPPPRSPMGLGIELAAAVIGFALVGYWVDRHFDSAPWGLLVAVLLGLVGGLYNFIRQSLRALEPASQRATKGKKTDAVG